MTKGHLVRSTFSFANYHGLNPVVASLTVPPERDIPAKMGVDGPC